MGKTTVEIGRDGSEDEEMAFTDGSSHLPRRLPWCTTDEDYEAAMAELSAEMCRWR
ncbi:MAG TPA: hypothetical protein VG759_20470 [Candidatus Angelobacter sp.]|nr:hypothetical protein [Candidatus Angelobacter sp.]